MGVKRPFFSWQYVDCQEVKTTAQHGDILLKSKTYITFKFLKKIFKKKLRNNCQQRTEAEDY